MKRIYFVIFIILSCIEVNAKPRTVHITYNVDVNWYSIDVTWFLDESGEPEQNPALFHLQRDGVDYYAFSNNWIDLAILSGPHKSVPFKDGEKVVLDYVHRGLGVTLSTDSPFFFGDLDFDGENEFIINEWNAGAKGASHYNTPLI